MLMKVCKGIHTIAMESIVGLVLETGYNINTNYLPTLNFAPSYHNL